MSPAPFRARNGHLEFGVAMPADTILTGDCTRLMPTLPDACADFVLTDPPYVCRYRDRAGRTLANDDRTDWLRPAFREIFRLMKPDTLCVSFYGWTATAAFCDAWQAAGFRTVGHMVFCKPYASRSGLLQARHESAYVLAKGRPPLPAHPLPDVSGWVYTGNRLHPTQKPLEILAPLIRTYCPPGGLVLDPFAGSGSTLVAARDAGRRYLGIELDPVHAAVALRRLR